MSSPPHSLPQPELPHGFCCSPALWRELRSFKGDWDRWSIGERLVAPVTALVSALSASVMLMNGL
jgi:hypothetical protein